MVHSRDDEGRGVDGKRAAGATVLGLLAIGFWGTTIAGSRRLTEELGTFTSAALVYLAAGLVGCAALAGTGRLRRVIRRSSRSYLFGCGGLMAAYTLLLFVAIGSARSREQIVTVTVANYLWPSLTLLLSVPVLGWKARPLSLASGSVLAWAGVALAVGANGLPSQSDWSWGSHASTTAPALLAAVCWGLYSNLSRRYGPAAPEGAMPVFLLATGLLLLLVRCFWAEESSWSSRVIWEAAYLALFPTLLAYVFWDAAARHGDLSLIAALSYLTPLLSVWVSGLYLGLAITSWQWLAAGLVVLGAVLCKFSIRAGPLRGASAPKRPWGARVPP